LGCEAECNSCLNFLISLNCADMQIKNSLKRNQLTYICKNEKSTMHIKIKNKMTVKRDKNYNNHTSFITSSKSSLL
jgi:metal-dependent HD superfamily phosphatase/phosphodiesterase